MKVNGKQVNVGDTITRNVSGFGKFNDTANARDISKMGRLMARKKALAKAQENHKNSQSKLGENLVQEFLAFLEGSENPYAAQLAKIKAENAAKADKDAKIRKDIIKATGQDPNKFHYVARGTGSSNNNQK